MNGVLMIIGSQLSLAATRLGEDEDEYCSSRTISSVPHVQGWICFGKLSISFEPGLMISTPALTIICCVERLPQVAMPAAIAALYLFMSNAPTSMSSFGYKDKLVVVYGVVCPQLHVREMEK